MMLLSLALIDAPFSAYVNFPHTLIIRYAYCTLSFRHLTYVCNYSSYNLGGMNTSAR